MLKSELNAGSSVLVGEVGCVADGAVSIAAAGDGCGGGTVNEDDAIEEGGAAGAAAAAVVVLCVVTEGCESKPKLFAVELLVEEEEDSNLEMPNGSIVGAVVLLFELAVDPILEAGTEGCDCGGGCGNGLVEEVVAHGSAAAGDGLDLCLGAGIAKGSELSKPANSALESELAGAFLLEAGGFCFSP